MEQDITGGIGGVGGAGGTDGVGEVDRAGRVGEVDVPGAGPVAQFSRSGRTLPSQRTSRARVMAT